MQINGNIGFGASPRPLIKAAVTNGKRFLGAATHPPVRGKAAPAANNATKGKCQIGNVSIL